MGAKSSRHDSQRYSYSHDGSYRYASSNLGSSSNFGSSSNLGSSPSPYPYAINNFDYDARSRMQSKYGRIGDNYNSLEQVTEALHQAGLESSNLIVGIDFTKSNEWTGARSFHHRSLHHLGDLPNPYEQAISIIGRTLSAFDEDNLIPCYGFGDATTHDQDVFSFYEDRPCKGFEDVLARYREIVPHVHLSGPTSFAPIIETAIGIVDASCGRYHVLMIIADGQVLANGPQERSTIDAIVKASNYPLSIVLVGVGDGPWDMMHQFDDNIPSRAFDNFQFVNFTEIMSKYIQPSMKETVFALNALMEIPLQYKATVDLHLLGSQRGTLGKFPLPPPVGSISVSSYAKYIPSSSNDHGNRYMQSSISDQGDEFQYALSSYEQQSSHDRSCPVCLWSKKDLALGCGHQTCCDCGSGLTLCPICRTHITTRIKLYE
ncbi:E3 ubiquitin-protein ligase RGLG2-like [Juglans microcarpa x Juglans regia]|uniref:E3 ubiquitin-protein ligase RGLG2-like n=1 Tax=Juglans microcarpa x Juglans regia TaxID=2249226 RepID=UPI001B7E76BA|nr:E3 ubiquitin-protein ligase RGLG2-like [Juglans microcarpa x Juglans regia]